VSRGVLDDYFEALRTQDWSRLATCLADDVHRVGPYGDVVRGKREYVEYLSRVIPKLANYDLRVARVRALDARAAVAELCEIADLNGVRTEFPEVILFELDAAGAIAGIDIYLKQPPPPAAR
jgi:SnoaL-like domain